MDTRFAISNYPDAKAVCEKLDKLIALPIHSIKPDVLKAYEEITSKQNARSLRK